MDYNTLAKGRFYAVEISRPANLKGITDDNGNVITWDGEVTKKTKAVVRFGIRYNRLKQTIAKFGEGYKSTLPWGQWEDENEPIVITHKGGRYVRLYANRNQMKSRYYDSKTGNEIPKTTIEPFLVSRSSQGDENIITLSVKEENLTIL